MWSWCNSIYLPRLLDLFFPILRLPRSAHLPLSFQTLALPCLITWHTLMSFAHVGRAVVFTSAANTFFFFFSNKIFTESSKVCVHVMGSGWSETTESRAACTDEGREGGVLRCETSGVDVRAQWRLTVHYLSQDWSTVLLAEVNSAYFPPLELSLPKPPSLCTAPAVSIPTVSRANTDHGTSLKSMHQWFSL